MRHHTILHTTARAIVLGTALFLAACGRTGAGKEGESNGNNAAPDPAIAPIEPMPR